MPAGPGGADAEGVYLFGEADTEALASDLLNLLGSSVSTQLALDRGRLDDLEVVHDTGWVAITLAGTWVTSGGSTPAYRVLNGVVYLRGSASGGGTTTIATLPAGARPAMAGSWPVIHTTGITISRIDISTVGVITVNSAASIPHLYPISFPAT